MSDVDPPTPKWIENKKVRIQKRTFTSWFNNVLLSGGHSEDQLESARLQISLRDGVKLFQLLEILSSQKFNYNKQPNCEEQKLENLTKFFDCMKEAKVKNESIGARDIYDGNLDQILDLIWTLIQHFQIGGHDVNTHLLPWVNAQIPEENIRNFTTDWNSGVALCALINRIEPDLCPNHATLNHKDKYENCYHGITSAEKKLEIVRVVDARDLCDAEIDERSVATYVSSFCKRANSLILKWIQDLLPERKITNLDADWSNGVNLAYLMEALVPGSFQKCQEPNPQNALENFAQVMKTCENHLGVKPHPMFDAGNIDEISMATYLSQLQYAKSVSKDIVCTGVGLTKAFSGIAATFEINATKRETELSDLDITITDDKSHSIKPQITPNGKGIFRVEYIARSTAKVKIEVKWKKLTILPSPFVVEVIDMKSLSFTTDSQCVKVGNPIVAEVKGVDNIVDLDVSLWDANGDRAIKADNIVLKREGIVESSFESAQIGKYKLVAKFYGVVIPGSSSQIEIVDPKRYSIQMQEPTSGLRLLANEQATFCVNTSGADFDCLVASVQMPGAAEPKPVNIVEQNGCVIGKFTPTESGNYKIVVTCAGDNVCGSPIQLTACDPSRCFFQNELPWYVQVNAPSSVKLSTRGAGPGEVEVSSSQTDVLTVDREENEDGYTINISPKKVGESTIEVKFEDDLLLKKTVSVCDANKCIASGTVIETGCAKCNEAFYITVQTKGAGNGELSVKFSHGKNTRALTPKDKSEGTYTFPLTSYEAGMHSIDIRWGGAEIPNNPFPVKVCSDAVQFVAQGGGLREATAHKAATFELKGPQSGLVKEGMLQVSIKGAQFESKMVDDKVFNPSSDEALVCVTDKQKGSYSVKYSVPDHGNCTLFVTVDDKAIPNSPFNVRVRPAFDPSRCKAFGSAIENPNSLVLSKSIEFKVDTTHAGTGEMTATATYPSHVEAAVCIEEDTSSYYKQEAYVLRVAPTEIGKYTVNVYWNGEVIRDSPFTFEVCDPTKVRVLDLPSPSKYIAEVNKPLRFKVDSEGAGRGRLECTIKSSNIKDGKQHEVTVEQKQQEDGMFLFEYTPCEVGQMQLFLTYNGENLLPSMWECEIANPVPTQAIQLEAYGRRGKPVKFLVSGLTKPITTNMSISVVQPPHQHQIQFQKEKQYESSRVYCFTPNHVGTCDVSVKVNGSDIHGSPFSVKIVNPEACIISKEELPNTINVNQGKQFHVATSDDAGPGEFTFETHDCESELKLHCQFNSTDPGDTTVEIIGVEPGRYKFSLKWGGYVIPKMPTEVAIFDPRECHFKCEQIEAGNVKTTDKVTMLINTNAGGSGEPTVRAEGPTSNYPVEIERIEEGEYMAKFFPHECGHQTVQVFVGGVMLNNCPLTFEITDSGNTEEETRLKQDIKSKDTEGESSVQDAGTLMHADEHNSQSEIQNSQAESAVQDTDSSKHVDEQSSQADFLVDDDNVSPDVTQESNNYTLDSNDKSDEEEYNTEHRQFPSAQDYSPSHCTPPTEHGVFELEVQVGVPFTFRVGMKNDKIADLREPTLEPVDSTKQYDFDIKKEQGVWKATCIAWDEGEQEIRVLWGEKELAGSPIKIFVGDRKTLPSDWSLCKIAFLILLIILLLAILAVKEIDVIPPHGRPT